MALEYKYESKTVEEIIEFKRLCLNLKNIKLACEKHNSLKFENVPHWYEMEDNMKETKTNRIIALWFKKEYNKICEELEKAKQGILADDSLYSSVQTKLNELNSIIKEQGYDEILIDLDKYTDNVTDGLLNSLDNEYIKKIDSLEDKKNEILTMLSACDTYEQEMIVLKTYRVVDKSGKLNV